MLYRIARFLHGQVQCRQRLVASVMSTPFIATRDTLNSPQEFGPRALGHRSLLASPDSAEMKERMNRLKARQWYRPVAPMIAAEDLVKAISFFSTSNIGGTLCPQTWYKFEHAT